MTKPLFVDYAPSFDPEGRYLYFLSDRLLNPVYDSVQFELSFPKTVIPCLVTLKKDTSSPFLEAAADDTDEIVKGKDSHIAFFLSPVIVHYRPSGTGNARIRLSMPSKSMSTLSSSPCSS